MDEEDNKLSDFNNDDQEIEFPLIHPNSLLMKIWNPILVILMIYTATIMPFRISF